jgi:hypothetical protein
VAVAAHLEVVAREAALFYPGPDLLRVEHGFLSMPASAGDKSRLTNHESRITNHAIDAQ